MPTETEEGDYPYLATCVVPQVVPIHPELAMVVHVNQLVHQCMLHVRLAKEMPSTKNDGPRIRRKAASTAHVARGTKDVRRRYFAAGKFEMLEHEHYSRA
jgi:hypothetical protein